MRYKGNKGANTTKKIPHAGEIIPHVAHGILKKMRAMDYNTKGKGKMYVSDEGQTTSSGNGIKASAGRNTDV